MADLKIRDVSEHLVAFYKQRAKAKGVSLEEELRTTLADVHYETRQKLLEHLAKHRDAMPFMSDSTPGIRAERDGQEYP